MADSLNSFSSTNYSDPFSTPFIPSSNPAGTPPKQNKNQIITNLYKTILGRDPDSNALMYYISQPEIDENLVRKQMIESEEHKNILQEFKNIAKYKKEIEDLKHDLKSKDKVVEDKDLEIVELNKVLGHKSHEISKVRGEMDELTHSLSNDRRRSDAINKEIMNVDMGLKKVIKDLFRKLKKVD